MTTRGSLQRNSGVQSFHGFVHKWKRAWVFVGDENMPVAKKRVKLLKWVRTGNAGMLKTTSFWNPEEKAEPLKGPRFSHLIPVRFEG